MTILRIIPTGIFLLTMAAIAGAGNSKDRVHVKIHVPEIVKKHIHTRTIYKHHYHKVPMHHHPHKMPPHHHMGHATHLEPIFNLAPIHQPINQHIQPVNQHINQPVNQHINQPMFHTGPGASAADNLDVKVPWFPKLAPPPPPIIPVAPIPPKLVDPPQPPPPNPELEHGSYSHSVMDNSYEMDSEELLKDVGPVSYAEYESYKPIYNAPTGKYRPIPEHTTAYSVSHGETGIRPNPPRPSMPRPVPVMENSFEMPKHTTQMSPTSTSYSHQMHYFPSAGEEDVAVPVNTNSKHPVWYMSSSGSDEHGQKLQPAKAMESDDFSHFDNILTTKPRSVITKYGAKVPLKELSEIRRRIRKHKISKKSH